MSQRSSMDRWKRVFAWIGAITGAGIFVAASCLQPIDGVPGYKLITKEDPSILFGFMLAGLVGGVVGLLPGRWIGGLIGDRLAQRRAAAKRSLPDSQQWAIAQAEKNMASDRLDDLVEEFGSRFMENVFERTEEAMSTGGQPDEQRVAEESVNRATQEMMSKYGLSRAEMAQIVERFVARGQQ